MKTCKFIIAAAAFGLTVSSCYDLDLSPKGIISEDVLLNSDNGIKKYLTLVYQELPIEDFNYKHVGGEAGFASVTQSNGWHPGNWWQAAKGPTAAITSEAICFSGGGYGDHSWYWPYDRIRDINNFLEAMPNYASYYSEQEYNEHIAEGRFLRAFYYFGLVKRYGGVPIVTEVQDPFGNLEELQLPRSTEYDCYKQIQSDLEYAMQYGSTDRKTHGRANRYAAAALMSRAMLFAASAAKYGSYSSVTGPATSAGLMGGMDDAKAIEFYQAAYDACKFLQDAGIKLHTKADKVAGYVEVFTDDCSADEDIFVKDYTTNSNSIHGTGLYHCWDSMNLPKGSGLSGDNASAQICPAWDLASKFEHPAIIDHETGKPTRFTSLDDFWNSGEMEARALATFYFPGMTEQLSGVKLDIQAGRYAAYPGTTEDGTPIPADTETEYTSSYRTTNSGWDLSDAAGKIVGLHGPRRAGHETVTATGIYIRKYINTSDAKARTGFFLSSQPWKVFRYGEVLCNWAEAAYELGLLKNDERLKQEAIEHINELRDRAGATPYTYKANPESSDTYSSDEYIGEPLQLGYEVDENLQFIRDERYRELCFENHIMWDIRRWRVAHSMYETGTRQHVLYPYYVVSEDKYIFLPEFYEGKQISWDKKYYYEQIPGGEIGKNPNLVRNDGY